MVQRIRSRTKQVLALSAIVLFALFGFGVSGVFDPAGWWIPTIAVMAGVVTLTESAVSSYFTRSGLRNLGFRDVLNLVTAGFGLGVLALGIVSLPFLSSNVPEAVQSFFATFGVVFAVAGSVFAALHMALPDRG